MSKFLESRKCKDCAFFYQNEKTRRPISECRYNPPQNLDPTIAFFTTTKPNWSCGKWEADE